MAMVPASTKSKCFYCPRVFDEKNDEGWTMETRKLDASYGDVLRAMLVCPFCSGIAKEERGASQEERCAPHVDEVSEVVEKPKPAKASKPHESKPVVRRRNVSKRRRPVKRKQPVGRKPSPPEKRRAHDTHQLQEVLSSIHIASDPISTMELVEDTGIPKGSVVSAVKVLEAKGLICRVTARGSIVRWTPNWSKKK